MKMFSASTGGFYDTGLHAEIPADAVPVNESAYIALLAAQDQGNEIRPDANGNPQSVAPSPPSEAQRIAALTAAVQRQLDQVAQSRNYDGILSMCSYANSAIASFAAEAQAGIAWRDAVWSFCYQVLAEVQAGSRSEPTVEQLVAELPAIDW